jgi:hypothetical protein
MVVLIVGEQQPSRPPGSITGKTGISIAGRDHRIDRFW